MNPDAWDDLTEEQRQVLRESGRAALDPALARIRSRDREALGVVCRGGDVAVREATPAQLEALRDATRGITRELERGAATGSAVLEIDALKAEIQPEDAPDCDGTAPNGAGPRSTPVDGCGA